MQIQGHLTASRYRSLGTDFSQSNIAGPVIGQESGLSGEETVGLISRLLDSKLDKKFADFKRALEQKELSPNSQIKKFKTEAKASSLKVTSYSLSSIIRAC